MTQEDNIYKKISDILTIEYGHLNINAYEKITDIIEKREQQLISKDVVSSVMYKAVFSFKKDNPRGGNGQWVTEIVPIQAKDETELKEKIEIYKKNNRNGYHKHIKLIKIESM